MSASERFAKFHAEYPQVYSRLVSMARKIKAKGYSKYSIRPLWEVLRYRIALAPEPMPYKLNDHYVPHYSRLIMEQESDLAGFFETRRLKAV